MRDRFGSRELSDELTAHFVDFTTNGSLTLPRRGLTKSASQGSVTLGRRSESTLLGRFDFELVVIGTLLLGTNKSLNCESSE